MILKFLKVFTKIGGDSVATVYDESMQLSQQGMLLITDFEGLNLHAYLCPAKVWTIGWGTTVYPNGKRVKACDTCTYQQAMYYKQHDLRRFIEVINKNVCVPLSQQQFDALVSLVYNIGAEAFCQSTLLKKLNQGNYVAAAEQFLVWNKSRGQVLNGLVRRRQKERELFLS